uniref:Cytochrome c oxidase subunit 3 n=1 Tax=Macrogyropus costalimai TaxID=1941320 RepID=A0A7S6BFS0_9NEOP|nr:cytochrome c oxidase subunit 3 [Macrogyropus costalimai]
MLNKFSYHIVDISPWPLFLSFSIFESMMGMLEMLFYNEKLCLMMGIYNMLWIIFMWMRDITREGTFQGQHTIKVVFGLKMGMIFFIISEILFFFSFFWMIVWNGMIPSVEGWPPLGLLPVDYLNIPLLGTIILVSSGVTLTIAHHKLVENKFDSIKFLLFTIIMGLSFTIIQLMEYFENSFTISDGLFGSIFYMSTGFHGFHVILGSLFLMVSSYRMVIGHFSRVHHFGFEAAAWYWHFVDVVWLFLFVIMYWWSCL